jgi:hypothetical protein
MQDILILNTLKISPRRAIRPTTLERTIPKQTVAGLCMEEKIRLVLDQRKDGPECRLANHQSMPALCALKRSNHIYLLP